MSKTWGSSCTAHSHHVSSPLRLPQPSSWRTSGWHPSRRRRHPGPTYTWDTAVGEIVADIDATVVGLRMELAEQKATYTKMYNDTRLLEEKLTSTTSMNR